MQLLQAVLVAVASHCVGWSGDVHGEETTALHVIPARVEYRLVNKSVLNFVRYASTVLNLVSRPHSISSMGLC